MQTPTNHTPARKPLPRLLSALCLAAGALASGMPLAGELEEVVVTAQKRSESLQDVPIAISAYTAEAMTDMGITTTQDLQMTTPGLVFPTEGVLGQIYLRGVGTRFSLNGLDPSIATYVGDRYSPRGSASISMLGPDVDRVEVLKGPQGILYGRNATGGAIRVIKKQVTDEFEGRLKASMGNYDYKSAEGTVNVPISEDFGMRLSGQVNDRKGLRKNLLPNAPHDRTDSMDNYMLDAHFRWNVSEQLEANLYVDYWNIDDTSAQSSNALSYGLLHRGALFGAIFAGLDEKHTATDYAQKNDGDQLGNELNLRYSADGFDVVSVTTYADFDLKWTSEGDGSSAPLFTPAVAYDTSKTFSQEVRFVSTADGDFSWTAGAYYYHDKHDTEFNFDATASPALAHTSQGAQETRTRAWAAFGQGKWDIAQDWALTVGVRYSSEKRDSDKGLSKTGYPLLGVPFSGEGDWDEVTPQVTLERNFDSGMVYLTYSKGFKSGGFNYPVNSTNQDLVTAAYGGPLKPEKLSMFELGAKTDLLDDTLRLNAALFYYDYKNLQVQRPAGTTGLTTTANAAKAEVKGLDVDFTWVPTDAFTLRGGFNVLDSEYTDYLATEKMFTARVLGQIAPDATTLPAGAFVGLPAACGDASLTDAIPHVPGCITPGMVDVRFDADGHDMLRAPKFSAFLTAQYEFALGSGRVPMSLTYSYKGSYWYDFSSDPIAKRFLKEDALGLLNARISYVAASGWSVSAWGTNLTDEVYFNETAGNAQGLRGYYGEPRMYGVDVEFEF